MLAFEQSEHRNPLLTSYFRDNFPLECALAKARKYKKKTGRLPKGNEFDLLYRSKVRSVPGCRMKATFFPTSAVIRVSALRKGAKRASNCLGRWWRGSLSPQLYVNLMTNVPPVKLGSVTLEPFGQGSGMLGLPGDFTPPSRFVRAVAFSHSVLPSKTGHDAILEAFHVLNQFDIPKGAAREHEKDAHGNVLADYTLWTSASDLKTKRYYFRTYDNSQIRMLDLMKMDLDAKDFVKMSIKGEEVIKPLNP